MTPGGNPWGCCASMNPQRQRGRKGHGARRRRRTAGRSWPHVVVIVQQLMQRGASPNHRRRARLRKASLRARLVRRDLRRWYKAADIAASAWKNPGAGSATGPPRPGARLSLAVRVGAAAAAAMAVGARRLLGYAATLHDIGTVVSCDHHLDCLIIGAQYTSGASPRDQRWPCWCATTARATSRSRTTATRLTQQRRRAGNRQLAGAHCGWPSTSSAARARLSRC